MQLNDNLYHSQSISIARTLPFTLGLLPSDLESLLHGLETDLFFRRRQDLQMLKELPKEMEVLTITL